MQSVIGEHSCQSGRTKAMVQQVELLFKIYDCR